MQSDISLSSDALLGVIVMPETTPYVKVKATRSFGAKVVLSGQSFNEAFLKAQEIAAAEKRVFVHAFNDAKVCAGQGTVAMEMIEQNPYLVTNCELYDNKTDNLIGCCHRTHWGWRLNCWNVARLSAFKSPNQGPCFEWTSPDVMILA